MQYLCLVYEDPAKTAALSEADGRALVNEALDYDDVLRDGGHYIISNALQTVQSAVTVRVGNGGPVVTDGPFAETKEYLGGFVLIEARDLNDAIRLATKIPPARLGCVEVRPIQELNRT